MERKQHTNREEIENLNSQFDDISLSVLRGMREAGALIASLQLRELYPDLDWSSNLDRVELQKMLEEEKGKTLQSVEEGIDNRARKHLLEHEIELGEN